MNQFFGKNYSQEDLQQHATQRRSQNGAGRSLSIALPLPEAQDEIDMSTMVGGESLDDIIMQNSKELQRRQSLPLQYGTEQPSQPHDRRLSMMEFGMTNNNLNGFQFGVQNPVGDTQGQSRRHSIEEINLSVGYGDVTVGIGMGVPQTGFSGPLQQNSLALDTTGSYHGISTDIMGNMLSYLGVGIDSMSADPTPINMFVPGYPNPYSSVGMAPFSTEYTMNIGSSEEAINSRSNGRQNLEEDDAENDIMSGVPGLSISEANNSSMSGNLGMNQSLVGFNSPTSATIPQTLSDDTPYLSTSTSVPEASAGAAQPQQQPLTTSPYQNVYSSSGFDMLRALMHVATRKNPEINIGAVDMSCAFVVCDVTEPDFPIVYVSEIFERLTGYNKHEILGQNCRFLQAPDGKVMAGVKRNYVDDDTVYYLKQRITANKEAQRSLINYRKGGQPFMNLLTMIPITWDNPDEIKYIVGFQVDLVEQPSSIASTSSGGSYTVNYSQGMLPRYVWSPPNGLGSQPDAGQTISRDDVSAALASFKNSTESEFTKRMWDKVLLENTDDVVHVLSLKGLFLYLSPSSKRILEYDPSELVGTALSSVCHPSDIVPVTRELKDTSAGAAVNVVFRIRRKKSGYTWFESHGSLCADQGKGRKCIILVGRERPVYALGRREIEAAGGIGENELWTKLSTSGMLLFVSSSVRVLLDRQPDELIGTSVQALMRPESKIEFGRCLERARTGKRVVYKHEIMNKRGQVLQAQTTLYPGDAVEGQKPTFLVGQTRLLKPSSRVVAPAVSPRQSAKPMVSQSMEGGISNEPPSGSNLSHRDLRDGSTSQSSASTMTRENILTQAGGGGLSIGTQDIALASEDNIFDELKTTRCTSWQFELRQMEKSNRLLAEELASLLSNKKKRKRRKGAGNLQRDCANCHTRSTPEWRRGPSGQRDLCNSCGLRWAKQVSQGNSDANTTRKQRATMSTSDSSSVRS
jgi:PAS domain S-box-containing protein